MSHLMLFPYAGSYFVLLGSSVFNKISSKVTLADCTPALQTSETHHKNTVIISLELIYFGQAAL